MKFVTGCSSIIITLLMLLTQRDLLVAQSIALHPDKTKQSVMYMTDKFSLNSGQAIKLDSIYKQKEAKINEVKFSANSTEMKTEMYKNIFRWFENSIKDLFTPDQYNNYLKLKERNKGLLKRSSS